MSNLYIFGASTNGAAALRVCEEHNVSVVAFIDNGPKKTMHCGLPVFRPYTVPKDSKILITSPHFCIS